MEKKIYLNDIRQEMSLKPNIYQKYSVFIEILIKGLNGDMPNESN